MGIVGGQVGYAILRTVAPRQASSAPETVPVANVRQHFFGDDFFERIRGKTVIDFGCGLGELAVAMALEGAGKVIGLDIQERRLGIARALAEQYSVADRCEFATQTQELADALISKDAFEHFSDPGEILRIMRALLKPDGFVLTTFGPTWLHPYGGHLFSIFPWSHLLFTENALMRWRADFKSDGATSFAETEGGLNQLTIKQFKRIVAQSPFRIQSLQTVPIRGIGLLKQRAFREFGSSLVRCKLVPKEAHA
jgi:SAM-dependent methyltransferase